MIMEISKWIITMFGGFIILVGFIMLFKPKRTRIILRKFASTNFINYAEITIRLTVSIALILYSDVCKSPEAFKILGWFMLLTSLILYCVPRKMHHKFSVKSADILKPIYFRIISPLAFLFGGLIVYNLNWI